MRFAVQCSKARRKRLARNRPLPPEWGDRGRCRVGNRAGLPRNRPASQVDVAGLQRGTCLDVAGRDVEQDDNCRHILAGGRAFRSIAASICLRLACACSIRGTRSLDDQAGRIVSIRGPNNVVRLSQPMYHSPLRPTFTKCGATCALGRRPVLITDQRSGIDPRIANAVRLHY
jgi:hypothetical protein